MHNSVWSHPIVEKTVFDQYQCTMSYVTFLCKTFIENLLTLYGRRLIIFNDTIEIFFLRFDFEYYAGKTKFWSNLYINIFIFTENSYTVYMLMSKFIVVV